MAEAGEHSAEIPVTSQLERSPLNDPRLSLVPWVLR